MLFNALKFDILTLAFGSYLFPAAQVTIDLLCGYLYQDYRLFKNPVHTLSSPFHILITISPVLYIQACVCVGRRGMHVGHIIFIVIPLNSQAMLQSTLFMGRPIQNEAFTETVRAIDLNYVI